MLLDDVWCSKDIFISPTGQSILAKTIALNEFVCDEPNRCPPGCRCTYRPQNATLAYTSTAFPQTYRLFHSAFLHYLRVTSGTNWSSRTTKNFDAWNIVLTSTARPSWMPTTVVSPKLAWNCGQASYVKSG